MPTRHWDDEEESNKLPSFPQTDARRGKSNEVLQSWEDASSDSESEQDAKAEAAATYNSKLRIENISSTKSKAERIKERQAERARRLSKENENSGEEDAAERKARIRKLEEENDLKFISTTLFPFLSAEDTSRKEGAVDISDTAPFVDFSNIPIFNPETRVDFENLCETLVPVIRQNYRKEDYVPFLQDFAKLLAEDLPGEQIKKIASMLTAFSNEKAKMEKVAERHGKKGKEKNKMSWVMVSNYEVTSEIDDFM